MIEAVYDMPARRSTHAKIKLSKACFGYTAKYIDPGEANGERAPIVADANFNRTQSRIIFKFNQEIVFECIHIGPLWVWGLRIGRGRRASAGKTHFLVGMTAAPPNGPEVPTPAELTGAVRKLIGKVAQLLVE